MYNFTGSHVAREQATTFYMLPWPCEAGCIHASLLRGSMKRCVLSCSGMLGKSMFDFCHAPTADEKYFCLPSCL
jgi:hypothetical protein